ncbi:MAG TPA: Hsp70 family protein [Pseudonocardiaceae bacterium]|jgi:molecular chaperone DnaK (HSP70)|nr:Hsp70 family protein [Pseudonocardiaceae bacterium]
MPYVLGIDVGSSRTRAAISRRTATGWSEPVLVGLGERQPGMPTVVYLAQDRSAVVGDEADRHAGADPTRIARGFTARIGDDVPLVLGGTLCTPEELTAVVIRWAADRIAEHEGPAECIVVTHPANWGAHRKALLRHELGRQGLTGTTLLPEPVAVASGYQGPIAAGALLATYSLGATTASAALVRRTADAGFELVIHHTGSLDLAGCGFDDAIMDCVRAQVGTVLDRLDPTEPQAWLAMARLRGECAGAKELLSVQPDVTLQVGLPDGPVDVRITRADFERIIEPAVNAGADLLTRVMRSAGDVTAVVPAGGSTRIPLVTAAIGALSPVPVVIGAVEAVALGAATAATRVLAGTAAPPADDDVPHTEVIERSAIELYGGAFDPIAIDDEFGDVPPPRPPVEVAPLDLPERQLARRLLPAVPSAVLTVSTIVVIAVGVVLTFLIESGSGSHQSPTGPLHLGPAQSALVQSSTSTP